MANTIGKFVLCAVIDTPEQQSTRLRCHVARLDTHRIGVEALLSARGNRSSRALVSNASSL